MNGEFINLNNGSCLSFIQQKELNINNYYRKVIETDVLCVGMDFNITNMACTISKKQRGDTDIVYR